MRTLRYWQCANRSTGTASITGRQQDHPSTYILGWKMDLHWTIPRTTAATTKTPKMHVLLIVHPMLLAVCSNSIQFLNHHHAQTRIRILSMSTIIEVRKKFLRILSVTWNGCRQHKTWKLTTRTKQSVEARKKGRTFARRRKKDKFRYNILHHWNWRKNIFNYYRYQGRNVYSTTTHTKRV